MIFLNVITLQHTRIGIIMKLVLKVVGVITLVFLSANHAVAEKSIPRLHSPAELISALQSGGHIIYMRHGITERKTKNRNKKLIDLNRCETQRNLTDEGRQQARQIGEAIKMLNIPIAQVTSSPYCRTKDTAQGTFGRFDIDNQLAFSMAMLENESAILGKYLRDAMLATSQTDQTKNTVFVGHTANLKDGLGVWPKPEGVVVVFKVEGENILYKGMIKPSDWPAL